MSAEDKDENKDEVETKSMSLEEIVFDDTTTTTTTPSKEEIVFDDTTTTTATDSNDQKEDEDETAPEVVVLQKKDEDDLGEFDEGTEGEDSDLWKESDGVLLPNVFSIDLDD